MNILWALLISCLAGLMTMIGSLVIFIKIPLKKINYFIALTLSFSATIMIGISILDLIPNSIYTLFTRHNLILSLIFGIFLFTIGLLIIKIFSYYINLLSKNSQQLYKVGIMSMIVLMLHNIPEGISVFCVNITNYQLGLNLAIAMALHNISEGISIAVPIYYSTHNFKKAILSTLFSALAEVGGVIISYLFLRQYITNYGLAIILIIVAGIMISLAIEKLYFESLNLKQKKATIIGLIVAIMVIIINAII